MKQKAHDPTTKQPKQGAQNSSEQALRSGVTQPHNANKEALGPNTNQSK